MEENILFKLADLSPWVRTILNWLIIVLSLLLCLLILPTRFMGMELLGVTPHWVLIWLVTWSMKRNSWSGAIAGLILGLIQDGLTSSDTTHIFSLVAVGALTGSFQKDKYIKEDFISIALIVFAMTIIAETIMAIQFSIPAEGVILNRDIGEIWLKYQKVALASAIISSLYAPVIYYPLNIWWSNLKSLQRY